MNLIILWSALIVVLSTFSADLYQDMPEPDGPSGNPPPPGLVVPIDDNSHLLAAAGIVLGIFFLKKKRD